MTTYEKLLNKSFSENITVIEKKLKSDSKGLCKGNRIAINRDIETTKEKGCVLAEEYYHNKTTVGNILNQEDAWNRKQEFQARMHAYNELIGLLGIIKCFEAGCRNIYEMANYIEVSEDFLRESIAAYRNKYGVETIIDNYLIRFIPTLGIVKLF